MNTTGRRIGWDSVAWGAICAAAVLVPFAMLPGTAFPQTSILFVADAFAGVKTLLLALCVGVAGLGWAVHGVRNGLRLRTTSSVWAGVALLVWSAVSAIAGVDRGTAVAGEYARGLGLAGWALILSLGFLALQLADRMDRIRSAARAIVLGGVMVSLVGLAQISGLWRYGGDALWFGRAFGTIGNPNTYATYLLVPLGVSVGLVFAEERVKMRLVFWATSSIIAGGLLFSYTRAAWLAVAVIAVVIVLQGRIPKAHHADIVVLVAATLFLGALTFATLGTSGDTNVLERTASIANVQGGSIADRLSLWKGAAETVAARPLTGWGPDSFLHGFWRNHQQQTDDPRGVVELADDAHSFPIQAAATVGVPGASIQMVLFVLALIGAFRAARAAPSAERLVVGGLVAGSSAFLVASLASPESIAGWAILFLALALAQAPSARRSQAVLPEGGRGSVAIACVVGLLGLTSVAGATAAHVANHDYGMALAAAAPTRAVDAAASAHAINPFLRVYALQEAVSLRDAARLSSASAEADGLRATAGLRYRDLLERVPDEYLAYLGLSTVELERAFSAETTAEKASHARESERVARAGLARGERIPELWFRVALARMVLGDYPGAHEAVNGAIARAPSFADAYALMGDIYLQQGDESSAIDAYERAVALDPANDAAAKQLEALK